MTSTDPDDFADQGPAGCPDVAAALVLRPAEPEDAAEVAEVHLAARRAAVPRMPPPVHSAEEVRAWLRGRVRSPGPGEETWVAEAEGRVVGYARFTTVWLDDLYVDPRWSGQGVGSALLHLVMTLRPAGFSLWVFESNEPARAFYRSHGLFETERTDGRDNEEKAPDIRMVWEGRAHHDEAGQPVDRGITVTDQAATAAPEAARPSSGPGPIMLVVDALYRNGATVINLELARHWAASGGSLVAVQRLADDVGMAPPPGVRLVHLQNGPSRLRANLPAVLREMVRQARQCSVVVAGSEIGTALSLGYLAARLARRPFVVGVHADLDAALEEWISPRAHRLHHWLHRHADGAVAVSPGLVAPLVRHGVDEGRVRVVRNGIDLAAAQRRTEEPPVPADVDDRCVVVTGRLAHQKGIDVLLRAHAQVVEREPHRVLLLNEGPEEGALRQLVEELGVSGTVEFRGAVPNPLAYVARAGLFCLPSRHEGLPLALIEAVALGAPCIAADCADGIRVALDEGRVGDLVPVDDVPALADALAAHLAGPARLRAKAALGPEHARGFDSAVMADGWAAALTELVS